MKTYSLNEIVDNAKEKSIYYKELYKLVPNNYKITDLPVVDQDDFWVANQSFLENKLLTDDVLNGIVFKSGGTTGNPKFSVYSKEEWETFTEVFGLGMDQLVLKEGDRVANLFYSGELYASFVFIMKSIEKAKTPLIHFPLTGQAPISEILKNIKEFNINVLAGVPTSLLNILAEIADSPEDYKVEKILYGGEALYLDQRKKIKAILPDVKIKSIGYASVDGGHLGYFDKDCHHNEHRPFLNSSLMEIIDDDGNVVSEEGISGSLVYTNLTRKLMPIIRYPVGDRAMWTESKVVNNEFVGTKFMLMGRSGEGARVGPVTVNRDDVSRILAKFSRQDIVDNFQMELRHFELKDELTIVLSATESHLDTLEKEKDLFENLFYLQRKMFKQSIDENIIHPLKVVIAKNEELQKNNRTGKLKRVIDYRVN